MIAVYVPSGSSHEGSKRCPSRYGSRTVLSTHPLLAWSGSEVAPARAEAKDAETEVIAVGKDGGSWTSQVKTHAVICFLSCKGPPRLVLLAGQKCRCARACTVPDAMNRDDAGLVVSIGPTVNLVKRGSKWSTVLYIQPRDPGNIVIRQTSFQKRERREQMATPSFSSSAEAVSGAHTRRLTSPVRQLADHRANRRHQSPGILSGAAQSAARVS
jgi:hypothetical protein